jgi:DNA repair photolyase
MATEPRPVEAGTILTETGGFLGAYSHTLNPYAGCVFGRNGCGVYCYVAESPLGRFGRARWGEWVDAKVNAAERLRRELTRAGEPGRLRVFMSSATDPYQPAEARLGITRRVLEVFGRHPIGRLVVQTRSPLVERDLDLLAAMPFAWLSMTVETDDDAVRRALTPTCPPIGRRLAAMRRARAVGVPVQAALSPLLPHDPERFADRLADACDRVVVDTLVSGDGAGGGRSRRRPLVERFRELGLGDWRDESAAWRLYELLAARLGGERVGWSREGFNRLAAAAG